MKNTKSPKKSIFMSQELKQAKKRQKLMDEDPENLKWRQYSKNARKKLGVSEGFRPYSNQLGNRKYVMTERQQELLDIAFISGLKEIQDTTPNSSDKPSYCVDISQSVHRCPWGKDLTCAQSSDIWHLGFSCRLKPSHLLRMHGWPAQLSEIAEETISEDILKAAIGEGQALQQLGLAIYAYWVCGEGWW